MSKWLQKALMWFVESLRLGSSPSCLSNSIHEPELAPVPPRYLLRNGYKGSQRSSHPGGQDPHNTVQIAKHKEGAPDRWYFQGGWGQQPQAAAAEP